MTAWITRSAIHVPGPPHMIEDFPAIPDAGWNDECATMFGLAAANPWTGSEALVSDSADASALRAGSGLDRVVIAGSATASDMAADASRAIFADEEPAADIIIYGHGSVDDEISISPAVRLQHELGVPRAFPFAIAQQQGASFFMGLRVADAFLLGEPDNRRVLIACADRWTPPVPRRCGNFTLMGDGAGAVLVERDAGYGLEILHIANRTVGQWSDPYRLTPESLAGLAGGYADVVEDIIAEALAAAGLTQVRWVVRQNINRHLAERIARACGVGGRGSPCDEIDVGLDYGYLSSADTIAGVDRLLADPLLRDGDTVLLWGAALGGQFGCCIARYCRRHRA